MSLPVATHARSWKESVEPKAQHEPQADWSRTSAMPPHLGQLVAELKSEGMASASKAADLCALSVAWL